MSIQLMGIAINSVVKSLSSPKLFLENFQNYKEVMEIDNQKYYPLSLYLDLVTFIEKKTNSNSSVMLKLGRAVGKSIIETAFPSNISSVKEAVEQIQKAHELFCKPVTGKFFVIEEKKGFIRIKYTAPYNCILQEGLLLEIVTKYGGKLPKISHSECMLDGKNACVFEIKWFVI